MDSHADYIQNEFHATPDKKKFVHRYPLKWNPLSPNWINSEKLKWKKKGLRFIKNFD
jgi:hypothetical protein